MEQLKNINGIDYFDNVDFKKIVIYSENPNPICDECLKSLLFKKNLILIPILNEVYCNECGKNKLKTMHHYVEDDEIQKRRTKFWDKYFKEGVYEY